jgi:hypothetical protein
MDLIIELKIANVSDWAIIKPLLKRLKIPFVQKSFQKEIEQNPKIQNENLPDFSPSLQGESKAIAWSPYDSYDAAEVLLQALKNN